MTVRMRLAGWVLWLLGIPCGDYGGLTATGYRWCLKPFGHSDSHAYDVAVQPLSSVRRRAQGWK